MHTADDILDHNACGGTARNVLDRDKQCRLYDNALCAYPECGMQCAVSPHTENVDADTAVCIGNSAVLPAVGSTVYDIKHRLSLYINRCLNSNDDLAIIKA